MDFKASDSFEDLVVVFVLAFDFDGDYLGGFVGEVGVEVEFVADEVDADVGAAEVDDGEVVGWFDAAGLLEVSDGESFGEILFIFAWASDSGLLLLDDQDFVLTDSGNGIKDLLETVLVFSDEFLKLVIGEDSFGDHLTGQIYLQCFCCHFQ